MISWGDAVKQTHRVETVGSLQVRDGSSIETIADDLALASWSIDVDSSRATRRTGSATFADYDAAFVPLSAASVVAPFGVELRLRQRLETPSGFTDWRSLATLVLNDATTVDVGPIELSVLGADRASKVAEARLSAPYTIASGTNVETAIRNLIQNQVPDLPTSFASTAATTPLLILNEEDDPWQRAQEIAGAAGMELFFDPDGVCTLRVPSDPSDPSASIAYSYSDGADSILTELQVSMNTEQSYSHAVFIGIGPDGNAAVRADAFDLDPLSPTYFDGPFGDKPVFLKTTIVSPNAGNAQTQANQAAQALLNRKKGAFLEVSFESIPIPLEASDVIHLSRPQSGISQAFVLDAFRLSSDLGSNMDATCRAVRVLS